MENPHDSVLDNVKFRKAIDHSGKIVDILDIKNQSISKQQEFKCVGCERRLRPRTGEIRTAHFYHHKSQACSFETYLHKLGKQLFYEEFQKRKDESNEFILGIPEKVVCTKYESFGKTCTTRTMDSGRVNLIVEYPEIKMETRSGQFIPDLLIFHPELNKFVFIEIVVSNAPSFDKLNSGYPIIQINAESENDFDFLKAGFVSESIPQAEIHNFPESTLNVDSCVSVCQISEFEKEYFETLFWIRDSFNHHKEKGNALNFEFYEEFICSRYAEKFETQCQYRERKIIDLIPLYESVQIQLIKEAAYIEMSHKSDRTKDILFIGSNQAAPVSWLGAIIRIDESKTNKQNRLKHLNLISDTSEIFLLETRRKGVTTKDCNGECKQTHKFFCIKSDMGAVMPELTLTDKRLHNNSFPFIRMLDSSMLDENKERLFFQMVEECLKEGIGVKNCYVCRYHGLNNSAIEESDGPIYCKTFKKSCHSNEAVNCERYKADLDSTKINYQGRRTGYYKKDYWHNPGWKWENKFSKHDNSGYSAFRLIE